MKDKKYIGWYSLLGLVFVAGLFVVSMITIVINKSYLKWPIRKMTPKSVPDILGVACYYTYTIYKLWHISLGLYILGRQGSIKT